MNVVVDEAPVAKAEVIFAVDAAVVVTEIVLPPVLEPNSKSEPSVASEVVVDSLMTMSSTFKVPPGLVNT